MNNDDVSKKNVAARMLKEGDVFVHINTQALGLFVPPWLKAQDSIVLQIGLNMAIPIDDLKLFDTHWEGTLSFNRQGYFCEVPWNAVYALVNDESKGKIWEDAMPKRIKEEIEETRKKAVEADSGKVRKLFESSRARASDKPKKRRALPPYMRVVK